MKDSKVFKRQFDLIRPEDLSFPVIIIGVGGIGSWTALALAKMGCKWLTLIDHDYVETHNFPSQFYKVDDLGKKKVYCLSQHLKDFAPSVEISEFDTKWQVILPVLTKNLSNSVVISALDSLIERKQLWEYMMKNGLPSLYLDSRMGGELFKLYAVDSINGAVAKYDSMFRKKTQVHHEKCTERAISYNTFLAASVIANTVKKWAKKEPYNYETIADIKAMSFYN